MLQAFHLRKTDQQALFLSFGQRPGQDPCLHLLPKPADLLRILKVLELIPDGPEVGLLQTPENLGEWFVAPPGLDDGSWNLLQLFHGGSKEGRVQLRMPRRVGSKRIQLGHLVSMLPEGLNQRTRSGHELEKPLNGWRVRAFSCRFYVGGLGSRFPRHRGLDAGF
jgi:hypothetical protein